MTRHTSLYHLFSLIAGGLLTGLLLFSCGHRKGVYNIDSLIEGYATAETPEEEPEFVPVVAGEVSEAPDLLDADSSYSDTVEAEQVEVDLGSHPVPGRRLGRLAEVFNDSNYRQYAYARKLGIEPITSLYQAYNTRRPIVKVTSNADYTVDKLTHSLPFLVPEAERLLRSIGRNFRDSLSRRDIGGYRILATSLLRTPATVKKLRRVNINATDSSTHQFGTTFDLSYRRFDALPGSPQVSDEYLKNVLAEVLYDLREQGRCLVKFERKTGCFHVTVTK